MSWIKKIFQQRAEVPRGSKTAPEEVIRFYQELGFFAGVDLGSLLQRYVEEFGKPPDPGKPWDDAYLLRYSEGDTWSDDPEADVCAQNTVYSEVLPEWARISHGAFAISDLSERWESDTGPIILSFRLMGTPTSLSPEYREDWIDLEILQRINVLISSSGRQFECAVDGNFAVVLCLTEEQKRRMQTEREFPFAW